MAYLKRKRFGNNGGGKRFSRRPRYTKRFRKNTRSVYKGKGRRSFRIKRPTPSTIFRANNPIKYKNILTGNGSWSAGQQFQLSHWCTPNVVDLVSIFGAAYPNLSYAGSGVIPTPGTSYGDEAKLAYQVKRSTEYQNQTSVPVWVTIYRVRARSDVPVSVTTGANANNYIQSLLEKVTTSIANFSGFNRAVIGVTPFDAPAFCRAFKIIKTKKRYLKPQGRFKTTYTCRPKELDAYDVNAYGILKGEIFDLFYFSGSQAILRSTTAGTLDNANNNATTSSPGEVSWISTWDYAFAAAPGTSVKYEKYIQNQMPNASTGHGTGGSANEIQNIEFQLSSAPPGNVTA